MSNTKLPALPNVPFCRIGDVSSSIAGLLGADNEDPLFTGEQVRSAILADRERQAGEAVATVIKKGADRAWMSERLGSLPDGTYSLYLASLPAPQAVQANWRDGVWLAHEHLKLNPEYRPGHNVHDTLAALLAAPSPHGKAEPACTLCDMYGHRCARCKAEQAEAPSDARWWSPPDSFAKNWLTNGAALHPLTANLVVRFARALAAKLAAAEVKYGYSDGWRSADWMDECRAKLAEHVAKGDPRDVAAYCAFLWHHGESTATQPTASPEQAEAPSHLNLGRDPKSGEWLIGDDKIFVPRGLIGAACAAIVQRNPAPKLLEQLRRYTTGDLSKEPYAAPSNNDSESSEEPHAERYLTLRRGQHWSVIDGIGNTLRGDDLDAAIDAIRNKGVAPSPAKPVDALTDEQRIAWALWRIGDLEEKLRAATQPTASNAGEPEALSDDAVWETAKQKCGLLFSDVLHMNKAQIVATVRAVLAIKPPAGEQITHVIGIDLKTGEDKIVRLKVPLYTAPQPEQVAQDGAYHCVGHISNFGTTIYDKAGPGTEPVYVRAARARGEVKP